MRSQAVQPQMMARGFKFWIKEVKGLYFICSWSSASLFSHVKKAGSLMTRLTKYLNFTKMQLI